MLTIYIPTFNRVESLERLLSILFREIELLGANNLVKIFVSDNASSDKTVDFLRLIDKNFFEFISLPMNIGGDANIKNGFIQVKTKYLWILGDDDYPAPGVLELLVHFLQEKSPRLVYLPASWSKSPLSHLPSTFVLDEPKTLSALDFIKLVNVKLTFISSFVIDMDPCKNGSNKEFEILFRGSNFEQLGILIPLIINDQDLCVFNKSCIFATGNVNFKYSLVDAFGIDLPRLLRLAFVNQPHLLRVIVNKLVVAYLPTFILGTKSKSLKSDGCINWDRVHDQLSVYFYYWIFVYPLKFLPKFLALPLVVLGRFFR